MRDTVRGKMEIPMQYLQAATFRVTFLLRAVGGKTKKSNDEMLSLLHRLLALRLKLDRHAVDAVADRLGVGEALVQEFVAEVPTARSARDLRAPHAHAVVHVALDGARELVPEAVFLIVCVCVSRGEKGGLRGGRGGAEDLSGLNWKGRS